jgi:WD40 repeat protein
MQAFQDIFISYGRKDSLDFAAKLNHRLVDRGLVVWFDFDDIPVGVDYQKQIDDGIERSDNFVFIISPHAVNSPYCLKEIELALKRNKRIIPVLHVERVSRETWQARNPTGTDVQWQDYQAEGLHDHFQNMHPKIRKINWIYFREGIDDFDITLTQLVGICDQHKAYVNQHTTWLIKALEWEQQQRRSQFLLIGEARLEAEKWLKTRFQASQPPCLPTDLHCEFITESLKNADNLMTQVFLSYADQEYDTAQKIRYSLMREGFTVWISSNDIGTGLDLQAAINRGIEEADNIVYLISPAAVQSEFCQQEMAYAVSLNKRIVPILVATVEPSQIPAALRNLQYIDLTNNILETDYQQDESQLIRVLHENAAYHEAHKILLAKALKWERQSRNPSILLRGYNLRHAEDWLKGAEHRSQQSPIPLQATFINESLRQPPVSSVDVFISYSRVDADLARRLNDELQIRGKTTWFDQESIASGAAFQQEIDRGIESADNFLFILSPRSINSPYCAAEVEYAAKLNKRFITVLYRAVNIIDLPPELAKVQWIDFKQQEDDFYVNFNRLIRALETDREHVHSHTKWSQRALEWQNNHQSEDLLLRGSELVAATVWLQNVTHDQKQPTATALQQAFIQASSALQERSQQQEADRQQRELDQAIKARKTAQCTTVGAVIGGMVMAGLAVFSGLQARQAEIQQIRAIGASAESKLVSGAELSSVLESIRMDKTLRQSFWQRIWPEAGLERQVLDQLSKTIYTVEDANRRGEHNRLEGHRDSVFDVAFSADGKLIATGSGDNTVRLWSPSGQSLQTLEGQWSPSFSPDDNTLATASKDNTVKLWSRKGTLLRTLPGHSDLVYRVKFSPNGKVIASSSRDKTVKLWNQSGQLLRTFRGHRYKGWSVIEFSPDGKVIASTSGDKTVKLWNLDGKPLQTLPGHSEKIYGITFSPDGKFIAAASGDRTVKLWNLDGKLWQTLQGHSDEVYSVAFSPSSKTIATASRDTTVILWNLQGKLLRTLQGHNNPVRGVVFSSLDSTLASASEDKTIVLWSRNGTLANTFQDHTGQVWGVAFSPDGKLIASASFDKTVKLWNRRGDLLFPLSGHRGLVWGVVFSPDGSILASASEDKTVKLWNRSGTLLKTLPHHTAAVRGVAFSPDGQLIASASRDKTVKLWNRSGTLLKTLPHSDAVNSVVFSPDGSTLASASEDKTVKLWNLDGKLLQTLQGHTDKILGVAFSPDGNTLASASDDQTVRLWLVDGRPLKTIKHSDAVVSVAFSPDGKVLASSNWDKTIKLWNLDGKLLRTLQGHRDSVTAVVFSPDGKTLASASRDKTVKLWLLAERDELVKAGCSWVRDYLQNNPTVKNDQHLCDDMGNAP